MPGQYTSDMRSYRAILSKKMEMGTWNEKAFWNQFMGFIGSTNNYPTNVSLGREVARKLPATGKPIEVLTNFKLEGGISMDIPVKYPLTEPMVYGDVQALGKEEKFKIAYKTCHVNQVRKPVMVQDGRMSREVLQSPDMIRELMESAQRELTDINGRWVAYQPYNAILTRFSDNLTAAVVDGGFGFKAQSHPNFYVEGIGKVPFSSDKATYETNVATTLGQAQDTAAYGFSTKTIARAKATASALKIRPAIIDGVYAYRMVISTAQAFQLSQDQEWIADQRALITKEGTNSPKFTGTLMGVYNGVYIYVDLNAPAARISGDDGYIAARGTVNYGNANPLANPVDVSKRKLAILFGESAVACGYGSALGFESETSDYKNKQSEASLMIIGFERGDIYDIDGFFGDAGAFKENTSSMVIATNSPEVDDWTN